MNILTGCLLGIIVLLIIVSVIAFRSASGNAKDIQEYFSKKMKILDENVRKQLTEHLDKQANQYNELNQLVNSSLRDNREELNNSFNLFSDSFDKRLGIMQKSNVENSAHLVNTLEGKLREMRESQERRLSQIQDVVDEKLSETLSARLTEAFGIVVKSLDAVSKGLDEIQSLASDIHDLRNALLNIKDRGTYGELRLDVLLHDMLTPSQFSSDVEIRHGSRVKFCVHLPGNDGVPLLLPIDSRCPIDDYNKFLNATTESSIESARRSLLNMLRIYAKDIADRYIMPPKTTDFALLFLPTEGLYAEAVRDAVFFEEVRDKYKVTFVGPATCSAYLSALQMGFRTLLVEQRSQEVWNTLRAVKSSSVDFEKLLGQVQQQLKIADDTLNQLVTARSKSIVDVLDGIQSFDDDVFCEELQPVDNSDDQVLLDDSSLDEANNLDVIQTEDD